MHTRLRTTMHANIHILTTFTILNESNTERHLYGTQFIHSAKSFLPVQQPASILPSRIHSFIKSNAIHEHSTYRVTRILNKRNEVRHTENDDEHRNDNMDEVNLTFIDGTQINHARARFNEMEDMNMMMDKQHKCMHVHQEKV